jgi:hypothetical protein
MRSTPLCVPPLIYIFLTGNLIHPLQLQQPIADSEWGIIVTDKKLRETIEKAAKKRADSDSDGRLKRIDWLGPNTIFKGLDRMEEFQEARLLPGAEPCTETWVVKLGSP